MNISIAITFISSIQLIKLGSRNMALYVFWIVKYLLNKVDTIAMLFMNWECDVSEVLH